MQGTCWIGAVETFSGVASVIQGFMDEGLAGVPVNIFYNSENGTFFNTETSAGFLYCIGLVLRIRPGGILWLAPGCSTWIWGSRSNTLRSYLHPLGNHNCVGVMAANLQVVRWE